MSCLNPLNLIQQEPNQKGIIIKPNKTILNQNWKTMTLIQCGKCIGCKLNKSREWATRITLETKENPKNNWFLTLTYNNEHLPLNKKGEPTLKNEELTNFIKNIRQHWNRKYNETNIKYISASEYGTKYKRPHYHIILMNINIRDIKEIGTPSKLGHKHYWSFTIDKIWNKGLIDIGKVTFESAGYVTRYTLKKQKPNKQDLTNIVEKVLTKKEKWEKIKQLEQKFLSKEWEKIRMSNGIGKKNFDKNKTLWYNNDHITIPTAKGVKNVKIPKYFDKLMEKENPELMNIIKQKRTTNAKNKTEKELIIKKISYTHLLGDKQKILNAKIQKLKKKL